jgi:transposase
MLIPRGTRVHLAREHVDFRKSIDGLSGVVRTVLEDDPSSGHLFVFHNRRRTAVKVLWWDHGGFCLLYKRLARGRFRLPFFPDDAIRVRMTGADLAALLEGIDLRWARRLPRWNPPEKS